MKVIKETDLLIVELRSELNDKLSIEKWENWKLAMEVRVAIMKEAIQIPERNPTTHIWHGNELLICMALWETTLSSDLWFDDASISIISFSICMNEGI